MVKKCHSEFFKLFFAMKLILIIFFSPDLSISRIAKEKIFLKEFCLRFAKFQGFASFLPFCIEPEPDSESDSEPPGAIQLRPASAPKN